MPTNALVVARWRAVVMRLQAKIVPILDSPVLKTGAVPKLRSDYVRDPEFTMVEVSEPAP